MKKIAFTLILNGMPFIKEQMNIIPKMFDKWYIIEGVANPVGDTSWCKRLPDEFHKNGLSIDGTTEYLDSIKSDKIVVIRSQTGFWNGKTEMCNSFMHEVEDAILMQIDMDEFWDIPTLTSLFTFCENNPNDFNAMFFKCNFFVGKHLITQGENCYGDNSYEWVRLWIIKNKTRFVTHEPPVVAGTTKYLTKSFTSQNNWIFNHYAYALEEQLKLKEKYYGYTNAVEQWKRLQAVTEFPVKLRDYFAWVHDESVVISLNQDKLLKENNMLKDFESVVTQLNQFGLGEGALGYNPSKPAGREEQLKYLERKLLEINPEYILEIGTELGHFCCFCKLILPKCNIVTLGIQNKSKQATDLLNNLYGSYITYLHGDSKVILPQTKTDKPITFAWVDGGHDYTTAYSDLVNCEKLGITNIFVDDFVGIQDVNKAVSDFIKNYPTYKVLDTNNIKLDDDRGIVHLKKEVT